MCTLVQCMESDSEGLLKECSINVKEAQNKVTQVEAHMATYIWCIVSYLNYRPCAYVSLARASH